MTAFLSLLALVAVGLASSFGLTYLVLRRTPLERYVCEGSLLSYPLLIVLSHSCFGYIPPTRISAWAVAGLTAGGIALSALVLIKARKEIAAAVAGGTRVLLINLGLCVLSAGFALLVFERDVTKFFPFLGNGEYLNYSLLASDLQRGYPFQDARPFISAHQAGRMGQDIFVVHASYLLRLNPWSTVVLASLFFRFLYELALFRALWELAGTDDARRRLPLYLLVAGLEIAFPLQLVSFFSSWLSSNACLFLIVPYICLLEMLREVTWKSFLLFAAINVYFGLTYPEFWPFLKIAELVSVASWFLQERGWAGQCKRLLALNVSLLILHPFLIVRKVRFVLQQLGANAGWNVLGELQGMKGYVASCLGLHHPYLPSSAILTESAWLVPIASTLLLFLAVCTLEVLRKSTILRAWTAAWLTLLGIFHLLPVLAGSSNWYGGMKVYLQTSSMLSLVVYSALLLQKSRLRRLLLCLPLVLWAVLVVAVDRRILESFPRETDYYSYRGIRKDLGAIASHGPMACVTRRGETIWLFQLLAASHDMEVAPLSNDQASWLSRGALLPDHLRGTVRSLPTMERRVFHGFIVVDRRVLGDGWQPSSVTPVRIDDIMGVTLDLHVRRPVVSRAEYAIVEGELQVPAGMSFPHREWVSDGRKMNLFLAGRRLRISGHVPDGVGYSFPYEVAIAIDDDETVRFSVSRPGNFVVAVEVDDRWAGRAVTLRWACAQTFIPRRIDPSSLDTRQLGLLLDELQSE